MVLRRFGMVLLALLFGVGFLGSTHFYVAKRMLLDPGVGEPWRTLGIVVITAGALLIVAQPIGERTLRPPASRWIAWPASLWMGFAFLVLVQLLASDFVLGFAGGVARAASGALPDATGTATFRAALVGTVAAVAGSFALRSGLAPPRIQRVEFELARWPSALDGLRIVQITDIHIGPILGRAFAQQVTERVVALKPDLIAVTGDLVDGDTKHLADEVEPFQKLDAPLGVYFVTGNHDYMSNADAWTAKAEELGMQVLRNRRVVVEKQGACFDLVGVDDHRGDLFGGGSGEDLGAALDGRDPSRPAILLAHDPSTFKRACSLGIDLQLSGHTHGGQIFPFGGLVRLVIPFVAGRYRRGAAELYVSRGTGFWGPPMRLGSPAEITEIVLRSPR